MNAYSNKLYEMSVVVEKMARLEMAMVDSIGLEFSTAKNSTYDLPVFVALTSAMSMHDACANEGSDLLTLEASKHVPKHEIPGLRIPTSQWALGMFNGVAHDLLEDACNRALDAQIRALLDMGAIPRGTLVSAYDMHSSPNYGKTEDPEYVVTGQHSAGTNSFVRFLTGAIVSGPYTFSSGFCRIKKDMTAAEAVAKVLDDEERRGFDIGLSIWDKGFYKVGAMNECAKRNRYFIMYAIENVKVKKAIEAYKRGDRKKTEEFIVGSGNKKFTGKLVMVSKTRIKNGKKVTDILPFFTNMPRWMLRKAIKNLPLVMKRRWRIETGYRCIEMAKPLTISTWPAIRTYMFWRALTATNLWAMADFEIKAARYAEEGKEFPTAAWSAKTNLVDRHDTVLPGGFDITLKVFLSIYLTECTRVAIRGKKEQVAYTKAAVAEFGHLFEPDAGTGPRSLRPPPPSTTQLRLPDTAC